MTLLLALVAVPVNTVFGVAVSRLGGSLARQGVGAGERLHAGFFWFEELGAPPQPAASICGLGCAEPLGLLFRGLSKWELAPSRPTLLLTARGSTARPFPHFSTPSPLANSPPCACSPPAIPPQAALFLSRNDFPGKVVAISILDLPFSISPVVTGESTPGSA